MINQEIKDKIFAIHANCNHTYDGYPYRLHLEIAYNFALRYYNDLFPEHISNMVKNCVLVAVLMHDTIEDCRMTYNDVIQFCKNNMYDKDCGSIPIYNDSNYIAETSKLVQDKLIIAKDVADLVYAVTNEKGRNRKERANDTYYREMRNTKHAVFVKLCDRYANVFYSKHFGSKMFKVYKNENESFMNSLFLGSDPTDNTVELKMAHEITKLLR